MNPLFSSVGLAARLAFWGSAPAPGVDSLNRAGPVRCAAQEQVQTSRRVVFLAAAAAAAALATGSDSAFATTGAAKAGAPLATEEFKKGTKETKKKFASICVSNATASICHG
eukprot:SM000133S26810  [mRNA]  locus=s133:208326:208953:+ [translate_table: standard]